MKQERSISPAHSRSSFPFRTIFLSGLVVVGLVLGHRQVRVMTTSWIVKQNNAASVEAFRQKARNCVVERYAAAIDNCGPTFEKIDRFHIVKLFLSGRTDEAANYTLEVLQHGCLGELVPLGNDLKDLQSILTTEIGNNVRPLLDLADQGRSEVLIPDAPAGSGVDGASGEATGKLLGSSFSMGISTATATGFAIPLASKLTSRFTWLAGGMLGRTGVLAVGDGPFPVGEAVAVGWCVWDIGSALVELVTGKKRAADEFAQQLRNNRDERLVEIDRFCENLSSELDASVEEFSEMLLMLSFKEEEK